MTIQTTIRRSWLMAAVITLLATGQAGAQGVKIGDNSNFEKSNVGIQHKKQLHRAGRPINFSPSTSPYTTIGEGCALRTGSYKDAAGNTGISADGQTITQARAPRTGSYKDAAGNTGISADGMTITQARAPRTGSYKDATGNTGISADGMTITQARAPRTGRFKDVVGNDTAILRQQDSEERIRDADAEHKDWLLPEGIPRELFDEFVYQWLVSDMNSEPLLEGDLDMLMSLEIEGWMTEYIRMTENGWMTEY